MGGYLHSDGHSKIIGFAADGYPIYGPFGYLDPSNPNSGAIRMVSSYQSSTGGANRPGPQQVTLLANTISGSNLTVSTTFGLNPGMRVTQNTGGLTSGSMWIINNGLGTAVGPAQFTGGTNQVQLNSNVTLYEGTVLTFEYLPGAFIEDYTYLRNSGTLDQYNGRYCKTPDFPNGTYAYFATQDSTNSPVFPYFVGQAFYGSLNINPNTSLTTPDYLTINRSSKDLNPWSRSNRWFHKDVIEKSSQYNNTVPVIDQNDRAKRPIIEFNPNLQLYDFGTQGVSPVDLYDTRYTQPFIEVEGVYDISIDGVDVVDGMRIIFGSDQDPSTRSKIWVANFVDVVGTSPSDPKILHLTLADDGNIVAGDSVAIFNGVVNTGKSIRYEDDRWVFGQQKTGQNQAPLFDVFDSVGISFGDRTKYPISNNALAFKGCKIFSYKESTSGTPDSVLGFPLAYKNFNNIGDIQFDNNFDIDTFLYTIDRVDYTDSVNLGFLHKNNLDGTNSILNVWTKVVEESKQYQNITYIYDGLNNGFVIDVAPKTNVNVPNLLVYVNFKKISSSNYTIFNLPDNKKSILINKAILKDTDKVDIFVYSDSVSNIGHYEIPVNLNLNAQNAVLGSPTLGELRNHVGELTQNSLSIVGSYPGNSNLRDIQVTAQGGTMLQQSAPTSFASMFLCDDRLNFVNSVSNAQQEYTRFKNKFLTIAIQSNQIAYSDIVGTVDFIIKQINQVKNKNFPWYYSDMVPYGDNKNTITYTILNSYQRNYEITNIFTLNDLGNKAVLVYLNGTQLLTGQDYTFISTAPGITISDNITLNVDDVLTIVEYYDTDGCWIPETPTKLGLYPKFTPEIYTDYTYRTPVDVIRGHDGSIIPAFGDFRDDLLIELERRIYNNIKVKYDDKLVNIYDSKPGKFRDTGYSLQDYNNIVARGYLPWIGSNRLNYTLNDTFNGEDPFSFNYSTSLDTIDGALLPGSWRACFEYFYDTQHPNTRPWEMLGFSEQPDWWVSTYGPAPYTSGNEILWTDLEDGYIRSGSRQGYDTRFARPGLSAIIPVNQNGEILPPAGLLTNKYYQLDFSNNWNVGQWSPVETAWRNSSEYPFAVQLIVALSKSAKYFSLGIAVNKYRYNTDIDQYLVTDTNRRLTQQDVEVNGYVNSTGVVSRSAGYLNWISDYLTTLGITSKISLLHYVQDYSMQLSYRMAGFSGKQYLKVLAEQNSPNSINESVIVPDVDFDLVLNKSTPLSNIRYSALIVEKTSNGYKVSGYDINNPYFSAVFPMASGKSIGVTVLDGSVKYFTEFTNTKINVPYGTEFTSLQQISNFISGYEKYLTLQGFRFDEFDSDLGEIKNWQLSVKEFLFWNKQNWPVGSVIVLSPIADTIRLLNNYFVIDGITNSYYGSKVMNQNFVTLTSDTYNVVRDGNSFKLSIDNPNGDLISFVSLNPVQYEHVIIFNNKTQFNDIIYDPSTGQRQFRLKLVGYKTRGWRGTLSPEGFIYNQPGVDAWRSNTDYLKGDLVEYKNFYYSASKDLPGSVDFEFKNWLPVDKNKIKTGLLNNFATNAELGKYFYNTDNVNLESKFDTYGLGLIGYRNRSYLNDLGLDDTTQVKFYQGFIKQKGTRNAINALGQVGFMDQETNVNIDEKWAFRVGSYGSLDTNQFVELVLNENYTLSNPTSLEVNANNSVTYSSFYNSPTGVYKTASTNWSAPFFLNRTNDSIYRNDIQTAGFVNIEDVDYTVFDLADTTTLSASIDNIGINTTIWTAKDYTQDWNVYRVGETKCNAIKISNALNNKILVETDNYHNLTETDVILMNTSAGRFTGFYKIVSTPSLKSFIVNYSGSLAGFSNITGFAPVYKLVSMRLDRASEITNYTPSNGWRVGDKAWINYNTETDWGVYNKSEPWNVNQVMPHGSYQANGYFGSAVKLSTDNTYAIIGTPGYSSNTGSLSNYSITYSGTFLEENTYTSPIDNTSLMGTSLDYIGQAIVVGAPGSASGKGYVLVYSRQALGSLSFSQVLAANTTNAVAFGQSLSMSNDGQWLYVGAPDGDSVYCFSYDETIPTKNYTITTANGIATIFNISSMGLYYPNNPEVLQVQSAVTGKILVPYIDFTTNATAITFTSAPQAGNITVTQQNSWRLISKLTSPNAGSKFGYSVASSSLGQQVLIGAPKDDVTYANNSLTDSGSLSIYDRTIEKFIVTTANQYLFAGKRAITSFNKVYINDTLQSYADGDYTIVASTWVQFPAPGPGVGNVVTIETDQFNLIQSSYPTVPSQAAQFGYSVDLCPNDCSIYSGAPYQTIDDKFYVGRVYRLVNQGRVYGNILGTVQNPTVSSGDSIRINDFEVTFLGTTLSSVISSINALGIPGVTASNQNDYLYITSDSQLVADKLRILPGSGNTISKLGLTVFVQTEIIENPTNNSYDYFGQTVKINNTSDLLGVGSTEAKSLIPTTFDRSTVLTTFDAKSTAFKDIVPSGAVWTLNYLGDSRNNISHPGKFIFAQQLTLSSNTVPGLYLTSNAKFGSSIDINNYEMLVGSNGESSFNVNGGKAYLFDNTSQLLGWDLYRYQEPKVDVSAIIKAYIYNADTQTVLYNLDYIDPAKGKILGRAEQDITYKTDYDPAVYQTANSNLVATDANFSWNDSQVGQVWWDLSTIKYIDYEQGSVLYRTSNWGRAFPNSSVDVYEWVESIYPPNQYVNNGGNGVPKYADNSAYVTIAYVDPATNLATAKYYYWVKDRTTVSLNQFGREIPTTTIAQYIENPKNSGIKYMAAIRDDSVAVYNIVGDTTGESVVLHVDYATQLNNNIIHSEYALLSENTTKPDLIPQQIYNKLVDSASGIDLFGNPVPDPALAVQNRYGIDIRPRQSMFVDKNNAIKEMVTYVNSVFKTNIISQGYNLQTLIDGEEIPAAGSGAYDTTVATIEELGYINPVIQPTGYKVLVTSDSSISGSGGLWTIYTLQSNNTWFLTRVESYRTSDYWEYIDWYATGFDKSVRPDYTVNSFNDLTTLALKPRDIVKVLNNGQGKWVLVQIFSNIVITVGIESGTIALTENLYKLEKYGLSFGTDNFDSNRFDQNPSLEIRKIFEALRNDIFINTLSNDFINLFFVFVYFVLDEQKYIDWAFKTSFIDILHKVRGLDQPQIYNKENQDYYKQYIEEVKPYHTTIADYIIDYQGVDNAQGYVTDFDVPAYYDPILRQYRSPSGQFIQDATALQNVVYNDWLLNYSYRVGSIVIASGGQNYTVAPQVTITGSTLGNDAVARALITDGVVTKIEVLYGGTNYITQPVVTISGGNGSGAIAYARLSNEKIRNIKTTLIYDRLTYNSTVLEWTANTSYSQGDIIAYNQVAYLANRNFTTTSSFSGNDLTVYPAYRFDNANDRIQAYYNAGYGQPGKDFGLLQSGINYPGVSVEGPLYSEDGNFDVLGFDITPFDSIDINDDGTYTISEAVLDTKLDGGASWLSSGTAPEDIVVDGGDYVSPYTSHAPEELVPGRVFDTLDLTVKTFATNAAAAGYSSWATSNGFEVSEVILVDGGTGYSANTATITILGATGYGATADITDIDANGTITAISLVSSGTNFTTIPNVTITGSNTSPARATVRLTQTDYTTFDYRIVKELEDNYYNYSFYRIGTDSTTTLASDLSLTANVIYVANSRAISPPMLNASPNPIPGVIYINGERITFWVKDDATNTLSQIRRGTGGTGATSHSAGDFVVDAGQNQKVPNSDHTLSNSNVNLTVETTSTLNYTILANVNYIHSNLWYNTGFSVSSLIVETVVANVSANVITTESEITITSEGGTASATDGNGLYASNTQQAIFVRS